MKISEREFPPDSLFSDKQSTSFDTWLLVDATDERRRDFLGSVMTEREKLPGYRRKPNKVISTLSLNVASCCPQPGFQFRILHNVNVLKLIIQHCKGSIFAPLHQINSCEILLDRKKSWTSHDGQLTEIWKRHYWNDRKRRLATPPPNRLVLEWILCLTINLMQR